MNHDKYNGGNPPPHYRGQVTPQVQPHQGQPAQHDPQTRFAFQPQLMANQQISNAHFQPQNFVNTGGGVQRSLSYNNYQLGDPTVYGPGGGIQQTQVGSQRPPPINSFAGNSQGYLTDQLLNPMYNVMNGGGGDATSVPVSPSPQILSPRRFEASPREFGPSPTHTPLIGQHSPQVHQQHVQAQAQTHAHAQAQAQVQAQAQAQAQAQTQAQAQAQAQGKMVVHPEQMRKQVMGVVGDGRRSPGLKRQNSPTINTGSAEKQVSTEQDGKGNLNKKRKTRGNNNTNGRVYDFVDKSQDIRKHLVSQLSLDECQRLDHYRELGMSSMFEIMAPLDYKDLIFSEEFLVKKVKRVQELFDVIGGPSFAFRRLGDLVSCNDQFCHLFGLSRKEVLELNFIKLFHRDDIVDLGGELSNKLSLFFNPNQVIRNIRLVHPTTKKVISGRASLRIIRDVFELPALYAVIMLPDKTGPGSEDTYGNNTVIVR
eukprot:CFRG6202T1